VRLTVRSKSKRPKIFDSQEVKGASRAQPVARARCPSLPLPVHGFTPLSSSRRPTRYRTHALWPRPNAAKHGIDRML
jgi:hypothetical protein